MDHDEFGPAETMLDKPLLVFVCGNNAAGKSTLGKALARRLRWLHLPEDHFDQSYLSDLFSAERRWGFEAQLHILTNKIRTIRTAMNRRANALIDRSPDEDAEVFAEGVFESGGMDARALKTYRDTSRELLNGIPAPDLLIYCHAPLAVLRQRIADRQRPYESLYPHDHLEQLQSQYDHWLEKAARKFPGRILTVDTSRFDFTRDEWALDAASADLLRALSRTWLEEQGWRAAQLPLFGIIGAVQEQLLPFEPRGESASSHLQGIAPGLRRHISHDVASAAEGGYEVLVPYDRQSFETEREGDRGDKPILRAYVAAPFTSRAGAMPQIRQDRNALPGIDITPAPPHGTLSDDYIAWLLSLEVLVRDVGFKTTLPHRDVNRWGRRHISPAVAATECTRQILNSHVMIAVPDQSYGVHYEIGVAIGAGMPVVVLSTEDDSLTFLMRGIGDVPKGRLLILHGQDDLKVMLRDALSKVKDNLLVDGGNPFFQV